MINQSGLYLPFTSGETGFDDYFSQEERTLNDANFIHSYSSSLGDPLSGYIDFDLGDIYTVDRLAIWNISLQNIDVLFSAEQDGEFVSAGNFELASHQTASSLNEEIVEFDTEPVARYMRLQVNSVYPIISPPLSLEYATIGEIAVSALPLLEFLPDDCNGDGLVDITDADCIFFADDLLDFLSDNGTFPGDLDGKQGVDFADFLELSKNFGLTSATYLQGDLDLDGTVGFADFLEFSKNFGQGTGFSSAAAVASVPEPSGLQMSVLAIIAGLSGLGTSFDKAITKLWRRQLQRRSQRGKSRWSWKPMSRKYLPRLRNRHGRNRAVALVQMCVVAGDVLPLWRSAVGSLL